MSEKEIQIHIDLESGAVIVTDVTARNSMFVNAYDDYYKYFLTGLEEEREPGHPFVDVYPRPTISEA